MSKLQPLRRSWGCPWHVSVPITLAYAAVIFACMHFVVRPMAARQMVPPVLHASVAGN